jgi:UDP-N-acetylmuramyl-tripeptide synthetase
MLKSIIKKFLPKKLYLAYHAGLSILANFKYGRPSNKLGVIGVTGTNGKSTTVNFISQLLENLGYRVGLASTVNFKIADQEWLNDKKMTMLGRGALQSLLSRMVTAKCDFAIIETSSEGLAQGRHLGINYDVVVFTNLTPEHIESHGGFENYKKAKLKLFKYLSTCAKKTLTIKGIKTALPKTIVANLDDVHGKDFLNNQADKKIGFSLRSGQCSLAQTNINLTDIKTTPTGSTFTIDGYFFELPIVGTFNVYNVAAAISAVIALGIKLKTLPEAVKKLKPVPGRLETIDEGQNFTVLVDYAPEPESLRQLFDNLKLFPHNKVIHVFGSCGGGRDRARRPILGKMSSEIADTMIITNEDPYDDDPMEIINEVASGVPADKQDKVIKILDRKEAIKKALELAQPNDLVVITGKGAEQFMCVANGQKIKWDDREIVKKILTTK